VDVWNQASTSAAEPDEPRAWRRRSKAETRRRIVGQPRRGGLSGFVLVCSVEKADRLTACPTRSRTSERDPKWRKPIHTRKVQYTPRRRKKFKVTFVREARRLRWIRDVPVSREGLPGSILDIATGFIWGSTTPARRMRVLHVPRDRARGPGVCNDRRRRSISSTMRRVTVKSRLGCQCGA